ncbi:uncharacterized protein PG986_001391 [Apiospora aurea]|uniref:Uncharacterized protein n=1 Tax=Apiospora aurea TaxID=335848 RepID=A0ABR1QWU0_9PEZI
MMVRGHSPSSLTRKTAAFWSDERRSSLPEDHGSLHQAIEAGEWPALQQSDLEQAPWQLDGDPRHVCGSGHLYLPPQPSHAVYGESVCAVGDSWLTKEEADSTSAKAVPETADADVTHLEDAQAHQHVLQITTHM